MTNARLDLRHLRLLLAAVAVMLALIAATPHGASAKPAGGTGGGTQAAGGESIQKTMAAAQKACTDAGGTWTVEGSTAYCRGIGNGGDYSCNLKIGPGACSHLPRYMAARTTGQTQGDATPTASDGSVVPAASSTGAAAASATSGMSPLDE